MPTRNAYNDTGEQEVILGEKSAEVFLINIDAGKKALVQEKAEFRDAVKRLVSVHKKYLNVKRKYDAKSSTRKSSRLSRAEEEVRLAVSVVEESERRAINLLKKNEQECNALFDYYFKNGKQRLAKKENDKFDKYYIKEEAEIKRIGFPAKDIIEFFSEDKIEKKERPVSDEYTEPKSRSSARPGPQFNYGYPPPDFDMGEPYYPPYPPRYYDPYSYRQSVNISPVNLDVSAVVEDAVRETMDKFVKTLEKRLEPYGQNAENPVAERVDASIAVAEADIAAAAQKGSEALERISDVVARLEGVVQSVNDLGRAINDMQRTAVRDMQGVQVKQKLVNQEQYALTEEQELARQRQEIVAENQKNLNEEIASILERVEGLLKIHAENETALKAALAAQKSTTQGAAKSLELQKELSEKQIALSLAVRESVSAQKQAEKALKGPASRKKNQQASEEAGESLQVQATSEQIDSAPVEQVFVSEEKSAEAEVNREETAEA